MLYRRTWRVRFAPDQPVDGRVEVLSEQVPQRQVDGAQGPDFGAAGDLKIESAVEIGPNPLDIARVAAEQRAGHRVNHGRLGGLRGYVSPIPETPASVSILTQVQCGQNGASSRLFQYTVSMRVIFDGAAVWAAAAYAPASGEASNRDTNDLRLSGMAKL